MSATTSAAGTACARCGTPWTLDNRSTPCAMALDNTHLFAEGVTAPEVERLRGIERAAQIVVSSAREVAPVHLFQVTTDSTVSSALVSNLRAALESK